MSASKHIVYCHCAYAQVVPTAVKEAVLKDLCASGAEFEAVADLCELAARQDPALPRWAGDGTVKIAACHPRAVQWLFASTGVKLKPENTEVLNMRVETAGAVSAALVRPVLAPNLPVGTKKTPVTPAPKPAATHPAASFRVHLVGDPAGDNRYACAQALLEKGFALKVAGKPETGTPTCDVSQISPAETIEKTAAERAASRLPAPGAWLPWFPVIDFDRCTNCLQCLSFCLFGVYGVDSAQVIQVLEPDKCKTNCPACSRVCPEAAIIFPKHAAGPINGEPVSEANLQREKMKVDISALLGGDIYSLLRERSERAKSRFSKERDPGQALEERRKCLAQLAADIPPEVLMALPSPQEIQRRADEAKARTLAARQNRESAKS